MFFKEKLNREDNNENIPENVQPIHNYKFDSRWNFHRLKSSVTRGEKLDAFSSADSITLKDV